MLAAVWCRESSISGNCTHDTNRIWTRSIEGQRCSGTGGDLTGRHTCAGLYGGHSIVCSPLEAKVELMCHIWTLVKMETFTR